MEIEFLEVPATTFLVSKHMVRQPEIPETADWAIDAVHKVIEDSGLTISGPVVFFYFDFDLSTGQPQHLEIGFPVSGDIGSVTNLPENYSLRQAGAFSCMAGDYVGGMPGIMNGWSQVFRALVDQGYKPGPEQREVYTHWVDFDSAENVTELQAQVILPPVAG